MQLSVKKKAAVERSSAKNLTELKPGEGGVLENSTCRTPTPRG